MKENVWINLEDYNTSVGDELLIDTGKVYTLGKIILNPEYYSPKWSVEKEISLLSIKRVMILSRK